MKTKSGESNINVQHLLDHIHSLHIVHTPDQISVREVNHLLGLGYVRECWSGSYALTDAGKQARKGNT